MQNQYALSDTIPGTFGHDKAFLQKHKEVIELSRANAKLLVVNDYQARVMTSTANGDSGKSYGWMNYDQIRSGELKPHMNPFGGEDRFWLGPEGGQFALYFKKGDPFDFDHWQTPAPIDSEPFAIVSSDSSQATFRKITSLTNYSGFTFHLKIDRKINLLDEESIEQEFGVSTNNLKAVAFQSENSITNEGEESWTQKNGLLSIWILGMFNPSDETVIVLPHEISKENNNVTDNYFGTIPTDRIKRTATALLLKGDGKFRGKVGIAPAIAKNIVGSYDKEKHVLTLVKFDLDKTGSYVNSKWELQKEPFSGDAVNSYNDGPQADGSQMGPFYELESSSPAKELKKGEKLSHRHVTLHLEGEENTLNQIAEKTLGVSLKDISFK
ncbi:MAG: hypothetical protein JJE09_12215 [Bacteroidia bacterium]|nr:hypothetical protein [Bacteroidia bacterium]